MEIKQLLQDLGIEHDDEVTDEQAEELLKTHISNLQTEKDNLSKDKEELTASVEGLKSSEENLSKELSEVKTKLTSSEAKLEQITELYKDNFTKDADTQQEEPKSNKAFGDDVLQQILDTN